MTLLVTGDEEIGSPSSRELIESEAAGCAAALVLEASAEGGALKTARKGVSLYRVRAVGRAAHAGLEPERGVNATLELAHQVLTVSALADAALGTTVTPTALSSGTVSNTVPATGAFAVDARMWDPAEQLRVHAAMSSLLPVVPDAVLEVSGGPNRPPLPPSSSAGLFDVAVRLAGLLDCRRWRRRLSAGLLTGTSPRAWERRPSTGLARWGAGRMLIMSTCLWTLCRDARRCSPR